jgi:endoglucanase
MAIGANLTGMQTAEFGLRFGSGTVPNVNFTVPRKSDVAWLAANGFTRNRLPIQWEMLQPMLHDTQASASARAIIGEPGAFHARYESYITGVLDAHAAAGIKCILDLHNYCRYRDFVFQSNGSVIGLTASTDPLIYAYTTDNAQVQMRIFALAPGATLKQSNFIDFWTRAVNKWKNHPGLGGYGLMNEPYRMPPPGSLTEQTVDGTEDLTIWPTYAQAAINAIRAIDPATPIYLGGNEWSSAMSLGTKNPSWPLQGANLIYEVHMYLDAGSSGQRFDFDSELALGYNAGFGPGPIDLNTGVERLKLAVDWAKPRGLRLALTETGMPIDDPRWEDMFSRLLNFARENDIEVQSWNGGSHWTLHNNAISIVPGWHQNRTMEPQVAGVMKASAGVAKATLYDDGPGWAPGGAPVTVTVYARGYLPAPVTLAIASSNGGTLSKSQVTLPAGANGQDSYTFTPGANRVTTLTYTASGGMAPPQPRRVYSLADPVAYAATSLADAALAIIAKYSASKWELADGYTDYMLGSPAAEGQQVRAIADSGYGSSPGNAMEMVNSINTDSANMGHMTVPIMRVTNGRKHSDQSAPNTMGFWCKKTIPLAEVQPNPRNKVPYLLNDAHFTIAAVSVPGGGSGPVFQASNSGHVYVSELGFANGQPRARFLDPAGTSVVLTSPAQLAANQPAVISLTSAPGAQRLRVNSNVAGSGSASFGASVFDQMLIGWSFLEYFPREFFGGNVYSVITGKGAPTAAELQVLERYLGTTAGLG